MPNFTLSEIATCLNEPAMYDKLIHAKTPQEFLSCIELADQEAL